MSWSPIGNRVSLNEYMMAHEFVDDLISTTKATGCRLSMDISRQTRDVIASNEALAADNIRATEMAAGQITDAMNSGFGELSSTMQDGFTKISYDMQEVSSGISELNATFHWGFSQMIASMGRMNDSLQELIRIAKTPAQTAAYNHYEIASDAFRQGLYEECLESLERAINGDQASPGYKLEWRFHQMKGTVLLPSVGCDLKLISLPKAEESFLLAARYAKADYPDHAAQAFMCAGWAAYCQGKMNEGLAHTEQALAIKPNLGEALFQAAKVRMALGEVDSALPVLAKAIDVDRFYTLKAAGDADFQRHDDKLCSFLDALRKEKYRQTVTKIRTALEDVQQIAKLSPAGKKNKASEQLEVFIDFGEGWPLLDLLAITHGLDRVIAEAKLLPITLTLEKPPKTVEETYEEQETYKDEVVIKEAGFFRKAITEIQTKTRTVTKKRNVTIITSVNFEFCPIPAGTFLMGDEDNGPIHQVTITNGFLMGKTAVTQAQWEALMGNNPSRLIGADLPVEQVCWEDCQEFINRLNATFKGKFRLPTEAEWEYACRAGSTERYSFGNDEAQFNNYAWFNPNFPRDIQPRLQPVGKKKPNAWGLHDMHGNVMEWCNDWYGEYPSIAVTDPQGPTRGRFHVYRCRPAGASSVVACASRCSSIKPDQPFDPKINAIGFRLAYDLPT